MTQSEDRFISITGGNRQALAQNLYTSWYNSPAHRDNMLCREYNEFGFGLDFTENGRSNAVQWFAENYNR